MDTVDTLPAVMSIVSLLCLLCVVRIFRYHREARRIDISDKELNTYSTLLSILLGEVERWKGSECVISRDHCECRVDEIRSLINQTTNIIAEILIDIENIKKNKGRRCIDSHRLTYIVDSTLMVLRELRTMKNKENNYYEFDREHIREADI